MTDPLAVPDGIPPLEGEFAEFDYFGLGPLPHQPECDSPDIACAQVTEWNTTKPDHWASNFKGRSRSHYAIRRGTELHRLNFAEAVPLVPDGLPALPEPPAGHRWAYRGMGWTTLNWERITYAVFARHMDTAWRVYECETPGASGACHYAEAVPKLDSSPASGSQHALEGGLEPVSNAGSADAGEPPRAEGGDDCHTAFWKWAKESFPTWSGDMDPNARMVKAAFIAGKIHGERETGELRAALEQAKLEAREFYVTPDKVMRFESAEEVREMRRKAAGRMLVMQSALEAQEAVEQALSAYEDFRQPEDSEANSTVWDAYLLEKDRLQAEWQRLEGIANKLRQTALAKH